jgi:hypothetical protein
MRKIVSFIGNILHVFAVFFFSCTQEIAILNSPHAHTRLVMCNKIWDLPCFPRASSLAAYVHMEFVA